jgi:hypothetical protein
MLVQRFRALVGAAAVALAAGAISAVGGATGAGIAAAAMPPGALACEQHDGGSRTIIICMWASLSDCEQWVSKALASGQWSQTGVPCKWYNANDLHPFMNPAGFGGSIGSK